MRCVLHGVLCGDRGVKKCVSSVRMVEKAQKFSACGGLMRPAARHIFTQKFSSEFLITPRLWREPPGLGARPAVETCTRPETCGVRGAAPVPRLEKMTAIFAQSDLKMH